MAIRFLEVKYNTRNPQPPEECTQVSAGHRAPAALASWANRSAQEPQASLLRCYCILQSAVALSDPGLGAGDTITTKTFLACFSLLPTAMGLMGLPSQPDKTKSYFIEKKLSPMLFRCFCESCLK